MDQKDNIRKKAANKYIIFSILLFVLLCLPKQVGASFCIRPETRYVLFCESDICIKGFKVEYQYAGLVWCSTKPMLTDLTTIELEGINNWRVETKQNNIVGIIAYDLPEYCDFDNKCDVSIQSSTYPKGVSYSEVKEEFRRNIRIEKIEYFMYETQFLITRLMPIVVGVLLPILLYKNRQKYWLKFGLVFSIQLIWLVSVFSTIICCGDLWSEFFVFVTGIILLVEIIIIIIIRPRKNNLH